MVQYMSKEKMRHYTELFTSLDFLNKGTITAQQLFQIFRSMHIRLSPDDVIDLISQTGNTKQNHDVSLSQFLAIMSIIIQDKDFNEEIYQIFNIFDIDKNKVVDSKDLQKGFKSIESGMSDKQLQKMLKAAGKSEFTLKQFRQFILDR